MSPITSDIAPTERQLHYLRGLAEQTSTTFAYPQSRGQASAEIRRLKQLKDSSQASLVDDIGDQDEAPEDETPQDEVPVYATQVRPGEVTGFGSQASWRTSPSPARSPAAPERRVGERTELARYEVSGAERVLYGQRINGCVRVTDRPASGSGRSYLVERELEQDGYAALKALVADYTEQARELDRVPMASSVVRHQLQQMASA